jgi:tRNA-2-methylthio-N6-dimethylallyladenosine synthase
MQRLYTRDEYMQRIAWMKSTRRPIAITTDVIVGFPGETEADFEATLGLLDEVGYDSIFSFKYSRRPNTSALALGDHIAEEEKGRRLAILQEQQRQIQIRRNAAYVGAVEECLVEGFNKATGQWIGRTSQNKTLNFLRPVEEGDLTGSYVEARVTRAGPNSLAGEYVQ